jgi:hypothetical protein
MKQLYRHIEQNTAFHQAMRRHFGDITASEIAVAIGASARSSPWALKEEKAGHKEEVPKEVVHSAFTQRLFDYGHEMEPKIADALHRQFGKIDKVGFVWKRDVPSGVIITASPDRIISPYTNTGRCLLEIKASAPVEDPPEGELVATLKSHDVPQILAQMFVTDYKNCYYARHNGWDKIYVYRCPFDPDLWAIIEKHVIRFVAQCEDNTLPKRLPRGTRQEWRKALEDYCSKCPLVGVYSLQ